MGGSSALLSSDGLNLVAAEMDEGVGYVPWLPRLHTLRLLSPWRHRDPPLALAATAAVRMVHRIHGHASDNRPSAQPSLRARLA